MILFFMNQESTYYAVDATNNLPDSEINKLVWLFEEAVSVPGLAIEGKFIGPRKEIITPWSTNAVEITQNMGMIGIRRIEMFFRTKSDEISFDPMLQAAYENLDQRIFSVDKQPDPIRHIEDIADFNQTEGLALNTEEIQYLEELSQKLRRKLTDSEIFGFSQVNSEHCRHKIFNGTFVIDGVTKEHSLFQLIRLTTETHPNRVVSAYKDNCAFMQGPTIEQFAPVDQDQPDFFEVKDFEAVFSLKAETHNFPTTVEPFNGAATGTGGEIRDRIGGGKASFPIAGTAVYMTAYPRLEKDRAWERATQARPWLYQTPEEILIKASNGASDFGNKFGQPLICGSVLTFEHFENDRKLGYDKVIMLAGGVGYGKKRDSLKDKPVADQAMVLLGGDNYRIGMGGSAVSSVATGEYGNSIELNAVQRSNPEMQKRVFNAIRALGEADVNPIVSIHDHGAGGHLNCFSELVEETGGSIDLDKLPIGDPTLSAKEIVGNESQERMGLVLAENDIPLLRKIADRERAPMYVIGKTTDDMQFIFKDDKAGEKPIDLNLGDMFGNPPKTVINDATIHSNFAPVTYEAEHISEYLEAVLQLESVACKDYLTNKVDRSVTGKVAKQQCAGELQLPLNNLGVVAFDYQGKKGIANSIGHAPIAGLIDPVRGAVLAITEALTNIIWAPIEGGLGGISLSANWMWPCKNPGEDTRLYEAVKSASDFALSLGLNIPTGKDSLSLSQKYKDGEVVISPGTVIISAAGETTDVKKIVEPVLEPLANSALVYVDLSGTPLELGGSSFAQIVNRLGTQTPTVTDAGYFAKVFASIQHMISDEMILSGHDVSSGGLITTLLEMNFANSAGGLKINLDGFDDPDLVKILFSENPALVLQIPDSAKELLISSRVSFIELGTVSETRKIRLTFAGQEMELDIDGLRDHWYRTSYLLDRKQSGEHLARERYNNYKNQALRFKFPESFTGRFAQYQIDRQRRKRTGIKAGIIREKGVNGDREMAYAMYLAGFDVKDIHMTDLISGRESLDELKFIVFPGGFSNSDVLGSARGWAGAFLYNEKAKKALDRYFQRNDTLSLGVCNGCQLMVELDLIHPGHSQPAGLGRNQSEKFESAFLGVTVTESNSIMLNTLAGAELGIWVAHGEGRFMLPGSDSNYNVALKFSQAEYPGNPNGSDLSVAGICSTDGRHLAMMPHLERAFYPWQWAKYPDARIGDEITPWIEAFVNARDWIANR